MSNFMTKITDFTISMRDWMLAGCPSRSPEWVAEIFTEHCEPCEFFDPGRNILGQKGHCDKCGCHVSANSNNPLNKIVDPNNSCPLDPPKWGNTIENREQRLNREQKEKES